MEFNNKSKDKAGFTLIELAIVIVIVGIIISIVATILPSLIQSGKIRKAKAILEKVDYALEGYVAANGQCPCPDTDGDGLENRNPGANPPIDDTCDSYVGELPYRTLGLSSGEDNWHNPIRYAVYEDLIRTTSSTGSNYFCYSLRDIINYYRTNPADTGKLHTTDSNGDTNQAYLIASGGAKDLDGTGGFFDGMNTGSDVQFESPNRIMDANYDDLMRAVSFSYLRGRDCTGNGGGGGGGGVENSYPDGCTNGIDDDGDLLVDCDDPDCFGHSSCLAGGENVKIATESVPSDNVNIDYSVTFTASGGITPYEWELTANGGFTDFYLHPYTGHLSGTLSQCPGDYSIQVKVTDSTQPASTSDTKSFNIEVTKNLEVTRTSGDQSTNITWDSPTQQESFEVNGGHIGDIDWTLDTDGATGFTVVSTDSEACVIKKNGSTTPDTYTFTLTAKDHDCLSSNTANIILTVEVTAPGAPAPYTVDLETEWHLDECSWDGTADEVIDSGGADPPLNGTSKNGADTIGTGRICRAGLFDGTDDYLDMGNILNDILGTSNNSFTAAIWIKPFSLSSAQTNHNTQNCFLAKTSDSFNDNLEIGVNTNGKVHVYIDTTGSDTYADFGAGEIAINTWSFVAVTYDDGTVTVTINSNRYENSTTWSGGGFLDDADGSPVTIGSSQHINNYFHGKIDEVMFFSRALTEEETQDLYAMTHSCSGTCYTDIMADYRMENFPWNGTAGEVVDSGTGASHGVAVPHGTGSRPSQTTPSGGKICRAGVFSRIDGNNGGYLDLGDPTDGDLDPDTDPWTISAWIKWDGSSGENIIYNKESLYEAQVSGGYIQYAWQPHWAWDGGSSFPVIADTWTYVTTVYDGTRQTLYKGGVQVYSRDQTGAMGSNSSKLLIGARGSESPSNFFGGIIDEVKIYNRALAENEIKADMEKARDCSADSVVITTTSLPDGTINSAYSYTISATGGTTPYGWELLSSGISGLSIVSNTGELHGTIDECAGDYDITVRVTDAGSRTDERTFTLTVVNGTLTVSPTAPRTFNCATSDFYRDFSVSGPRMGALGNWTITWLGTDPGGFEIVQTGDATVKFRKIGTSTAGTGYQFKLTANDSVCTDNQVDSGFYTLNVSGEGADTPYYAGRVGEWWLDESSGTIVDHSGQNNNGTAYGGVTYGVQGKVWAALEFDGSSGYVDCGNNASLDISTGDFTVGAWVKPQNNSYFVDKGTGNLVDGYGLAVIGNKFAFVTDGDGSSGGKRTLYGDNTITFGNWYHVVGVQESGVKKIYVDTVPQSSTQSESRELSDTSRHFLIGKPDADGGYFHGVVDEVVIYTRALSQGEITDLYNEASLVAYYKMDEAEGDIYDYSGQANHGTNYGAAYGATGKVGYALEFDGTDYVNVGNNEILSPPSITISAWVKASQLDTWNGIINNKPNANYGINLQMGTAQNIAALVGNGSACTYVRTSWAPSLDTWYHIAITHNASDNNIIYVNGNNEAEKTFALAYTSPVDTIIGRFYTGSLPFKGLIDEVRIYTRVLSGAEVTELYNKGMEETE